ncbi:MAG: hypothetical protein OXI15_02290 [Chromatiales bacterium]|nr:hypothetical protein [Chromatiales bacterium]
MTHTDRQTWIAALAVILTVIGAAWWTGRQMATREDLAREIAQVRADIADGRRSADEQMRELRGYIVQHLDGHAPDPD